AAIKSRYHIKGLSVGQCDVKTFRAVNEYVIGVKIRRKFFHHLAEMRGRYDGKQNFTLSGYLFQIIGRDHILVHHMTAMFSCLFDFSDDGFVARIEQYLAM